MIRFTISISLITLLLSLIYSCDSQNSQTTDISDKIGLIEAEKAGFKFTLQTYPYRNISLLKAIDTIAHLDVKNIEVYSQHSLGEDFQNKVFGPQLTEQECNKLKEYAKQYDIKIVGYGVFSTTNEEEWKSLFVFAKKMDLSYVVCNPQPKHLDLIEELATKYNIKAAIHNELNRENYWNPDILLKDISHRTTNIMGSCADVGNWKKNGLDPVNSLNKLKT